MTENDTLAMQTWVNDLQITVDSLREQREEDRKTIADLQNKLDVYKTTTLKLHQALSQYT